MHIRLISIGKLKSGPEKDMVDDYVSRFEARDETRLFYVYHSSKGDLATSAPGCTLIGPERLAGLALDAGLVTWLIEKAN